MKVKYTVDGQSEYRAYLLVTQLKGLLKAEVHSLQVATPFRRRGFGNDLLTQCCRDADAEGVTLELFAAADIDAMPNDLLVKWYCKFGFVVTGTGMLERKPQPLAGVRRKGNSRLTASNLSARVAGRKP